MDTNFGDLPRQHKTEVYNVYNGEMKEYKQDEKDNPFPHSNENNIPQLLQLNATLRETIDGLKKELSIKSMQFEALKKVRDELLAENTYLKNR